MGKEKRFDESSISHDPGGDVLMDENRKSWEKNYTIIEHPKSQRTLGSGGNAKVYRVECKEDQRKYALKYLLDKLMKDGDKSEKVVRFRNEIDVMEKCKGIPGIIPIISSSKDECWYVMPIATPIMEYISDNRIDIKGIVSCVISLAETLEKLHEKDICHRDIKPDNLYYYDGRPAFGDLGLVDFPENDGNLTKSNKRLGATFTIAPEMKRNPKEADSKKADVYSLAKTMWMLLVDDKKGFDGVYDYLDPSHGLSYRSKYRNEHLVELEELLRDSTDNNPNHRPTITEFKERLLKWKEIYSDFQKSQESDWNFLNKQLFGVIPPESARWRDVHDIVDVLNIIGRSSAYNHMLLSSNGGWDFSFAKPAAEEGCIKIYASSDNICYIVKPKVLYFEGFRKDYIWNYFLLEFDELDPVFKGKDVDTEYLVEDYPGHYVSAKYEQYGVYDYDTGEVLPDGYEVVYRYLRGSFLIVMKQGPYNGISSTYDGRHADCSPDKFREYIKSLIDKYHKFLKLAKKRGELQGLSDEEIQNRILRLAEFDDNPFEIEKKEDESAEITRDASDFIECEHYIRDHFGEWNFYNLLPDKSSKKSMNYMSRKFFFTLLYPTIHSLDDALQELKGTGYYLTEAGNIKKLDFDDDECFGLFDMNEAINFVDTLNKEVEKILHKSDLMISENSRKHFSIFPIGSKKPLHLFTKKEIESAMRNADDRVDNQLVIDEDGYAKIIEGRFEYVEVYPVKSGLWTAGGVYVGKYATLSMLDDIYYNMLRGWLSYLKTGRTQYAGDLWDLNQDETDLIQEIKMYY